MYYLQIILITAFVLYYFVVLRPYGGVNANALFVYIQMIMAIGTFSVLEDTNYSDYVYGYVVLISTLTYLVASALYFVVKRPLPAPGSQARILKPTVEMWTLLVLSVVIVVVYFFAVGYSALIQGLGNSLSGGDADIAGQRLNSYAGARYLFPGYVNQFKNAVLPALTVMVLTYWFSVKRHHIFLTAILVAVSLFGLLGTGQRGAFIQFASVIIVYIYLLNGRRLPSKSGVTIAVVGLLFMVASTVALGRSNSSISANAGILERLTVAIGGLGGRIFEVQQDSAVTGFRYILQQPIQWGLEWWQGLTGILPGSGGTTLPNRIYGSLYGTDRGTAPPSVWGSVFHNFGWLGVFAFPALFAVAIGSVTKRSLTPRRKNTLELVGIAGVSTSIGFWAAGGPESLLNTGLAAYAVLWWWGRRIEGRQSAGDVMTGIQNTPAERCSRGPVARGGHGSRQL